jgi:hypothetical protein
VASFPLQRRWPKATDVAAQGRPAAAADELLRFLSKEGEGASVGLMLGQRLRGAGSEWT